MRGPLAWTLTAVALALACAQPAAAALDTIGPNGALSFQKQVSNLGVSWSLEGVPDIDQARGTNGSGTKVGLPNGGYMYCVPTTGMDFLAFLADRGFAGSLGVPSKDWTDAKNFNQMSVLLAQLGGEMGTDPEDGTSGSGFVTAMTKRLAESEIGTLQVSTYSIDSQGGEPTVSDVIESGADGALLSAGIGFYQDEEKGDKTYKRRVGGHAFAIVGGSGLPGSKSGTVFTRDPATVYTADFTQGAYTTDSHAVTPLSTSFIGEDSNGVDQTWDATVAKWDGSETTLFEGFTRIVPKTTWVGLGKKLERVVPFELIPDPGPLKTIYEVPGGGSVKSLALSAITNRPAFLVNGSSNVYELDPLSGASRKLASLPGAQTLTFGGAAQRLYVGGANKLVALDRAGKVVDARAVPGGVQALSFDEESGRLAAVSAGKLMLFDSALKPAAASRALPAVQGNAKGAPLLAFGPKGRLVVGQAGQGKVLVSNANAVASRRARASATTPLKITVQRRPLAGGGKIDGLAVDDLGQIIASVGGRLRVYSSKGGRRAGSPFNGAVGGKVLAVTRSFDTTAGVPGFATLDKTVGPPPLTPAEPPPPPAMPNLVVRAVPDSTIIVVRNIGNADAGPFDVRLADPTGATSAQRFPGLAAGAEIALRNPCATGRTFTADSGGEVAESDETDNVHAC
jgi:hypothetical protein